MRLGASVRALSEEVTLWQMVSSRIRHVGAGQRADASKREGASKKAGARATAAGCGPGAWLSLPAESTKTLGSARLSTIDSCSTAEPGFDQADEASCSPATTARLRRFKSRWGKRCSISARNPYLKITTPFLLAGIGAWVPWTWQALWLGCLGP